nr:O-antigen ligase family protein [uncultured Flavobacterium sp.]
MLDTLKKNGFEYLAYGLIVSLFFSKAIPNIFLAVLSLWTVIDFKSIQKPKFKFSSSIFLLVLLLFLSLKSILFGTINYDLKVYKGIILLFWLSIVFQKIKNLDRLKTVLLCGITLVVLSSIFLISLYYFENKNLPFSNTAEVNELLLLERPYMGFIAVLGIILAIEKTVKSSTLKKIWFINALLLFLFIILISARISLITLFVAAGLYLLFYLKISKLKKALILISLTIGFGVLVFTNKNISERFFIKSNFSESLKTASDYEPRIVIWDCAYQMTKENDFNFLTGFQGYQIIKEHFWDCYSSKIENESKRNYFLTEKFNSHNQFIDFYLIGGILALILFVVFFIKLIEESRSDFFKVATVVSFLLFFIVENIFYRQFGCYLFGIFILILPHTEINEEN